MSACFSNPHMKIIDCFYFLAGIIFMILAKIKNLIYGYSSPKPFSVNQFQRSIEYDIKIVDHWISYLTQYIGEDGNKWLIGKKVLELGPGSDLGTGLYLLYKGIARYIAIDVNNLAYLVSDDFYAQLINYIAMKHFKDLSELEWIKNEFILSNRGRSSLLEYNYNENFEKALISHNNVDIVFSQAAFEHFDDIETTIKCLSEVAKSGTIIVAEIDLKTHSRWVRDRDPNNIYRYSRKFYGIFAFRGIPNRFRPYQYKTVLENYGWKDVWIVPLDTLCDGDVESLTCSLDKEFRQQRNQMSYLSIMVCARKA
jgi:hypothetical protein